MVNVFKKFAVLALALTLALGVAAPAFAASSPSTAKKYVTKDMVKDSKTKKNEYKVFKSGNAHLKSLKVPAKKTATVPTTMKYKGVTYKVTWIRANSFRKNSKLKTVIIKGNIKRINKNAFKQSNVKTVKFAGKNVPKTIKKGAFNNSKVKTIKISKKISKANYKKLKKKIKKSGFKGKIKRY